MASCKSEYLTAWFDNSISNTSILALLIDNGVDVNAVDLKGNTKLMNAICHDQRNIKLIEYLLSIPGIDVNKSNNHKYTPLHYAERYDIVNLLVNAGADINAINCHGNSPIMTNKSDDAINYLAENGADLTIKNKQGETVYDMVNDHDILKTPVNFINEYFKKIKDNEKVTVIENIIAILSKEQKSELFQKILKSV
jgi:ankyrin repeat protein